jgi:hypothetical protein
VVVAANIHIPQEDFAKYWLNERYDLESYFKNTIQNIQMQK